MDDFIRLFDFCLIGGGLAPGMLGQEELGVTGWSRKLLEVGVPAVFYYSFGLALLGPDHC